MSEPYMIKQTIQYSDGSETVLNFNANNQQEEIETIVAEAVAITSPEVESVVTASEDVSKIDNETVTSTESEE